MRGGARLIVEIPVRHGKALDVETPIPTPWGWCPIGDLVAGDMVFDERGELCTVVEAFPAYWSDDVYELTFGDGSMMVADGPHQWLTYSYHECQAIGDYRRWHRRPNRSWPDDWATRQETPSRTPKVRRTADLVHERCYIPTSAALRLPGRYLALDPYVLGLWLGDGHSISANIAAHRDDVPYHRSQIEAAGFTTGMTAAGCVAISPVGHGRRNPFMTALWVLGIVAAKRVPECYLRSSAPQRLALLQGLMDSDGGVENSTRNTGRVSFTNQNRQIADSVAELFVSLGAKITRDARPAKINGRETGKTAYRVSSSPPFNPFRLPRKADAWSDDSKGSLTRRTRPIRSVMPAAGRMVRCIAVSSPSHLYLAGESMIPTHNSEYSSHWLPVWFLSTFHDRHVIECGYRDEFARYWGRRVRNTIIRDAAFLETGIRRDSKSAQEWETTTGGGMLSAGIGGGISGRGASLFLIDDAVKSREEAESQLVRESTWEWWQETARPRLEPGASVVVVGSRWHEEDLSGRLQARMEEPWQVIRLPALAEDNDPLGRAPGSAFPDDQPEAGGEALWPERYDRPALLAIKKAVGTRAWTSNYQQRPRPLEGSLIKPHQLRYYVEEGSDFVLFLPDGTRVRRPISQGIRFATVDLAVSLRTTAHFFAVTAFHLTHHSELLALDAYRDRIEGPDQLPSIQAMIDKWGLSYAGIERFGYQLAIIQDARRKGMPVKELGVTPQERGDKMARAQSLAVRAQGGGLYLRRGADWLDWVEAEITGFPVEGAAGGDFDTLDTFAYAAIIASKGDTGKLQISFRSGGRA